MTVVPFPGAQQRAIDAAHDAWVGYIRACESGVDGMPAFRVLADAMAALHPLTSGAGQAPVGAAGDDGAILAAPVVAAAPEPDTQTSGAEVAAPFVCDEVAIANPLDSTVEAQAASAPEPDPMDDDRWPARAATGGSGGGRLFDREA